MRRRVDAGRPGHRRFRGVPAGPLDRRAHEPGDHRGAVHLRPHPGRRVLPYLVAQIAGSIAAAAVAGLVWGSAMAASPTRYAVVQPRTGTSGTMVALAEAAVLAIIVAAICWVPDHRPSWPMPWIVGMMFGVQGALLGTLTGGSANPARQLGPALFAGQTHVLAAYLIAPVAGAALAAWALRRRLTAPSRTAGAR
ncbi:aquaporin [Paractinoplanes durhamensis]|uniref:aquaporin n=1 Tax=Paractinoplanes durhamensis TaxID=113563 RepID=UPI003635DC24